MLKLFLVILSALLVGAFGVLAYAGHRWKASTAELVARLDDSSKGAVPGAYSASELASLPAPVQRYFRAVLREGRPMVQHARFSQVGEFLLRPSPEGYRPFGASHYVRVRPAGFVWDARIRMARMLPVHVRDGFVDGTGFMYASMLGTFTLVRVEGTPGIAAGALQRYLAEAAWYPTALLPSQGVSWSAIDDRTARATLSAEGTTVSLEIRFGDDALIRSVFVADRVRSVDGRDVPTPWQGRFYDYEEHAGMRIPTRGEVEWLLPEGPQVYWKGRLTEAIYE